MNSRDLGSILLVAGCCIGAGMLGLPILSAPAGYLPAVAMFILTWLFVVASGFLVLEVNLWFREEVNIVSMAERVLGNGGRIAAWVLFLYLFYSILVSYIGGCGSLFNEVTNLPAWVGSVGFSALFAFVIYFGTEAVDQFNRLLMAGLIISYFLLVVMGLPEIRADHLFHKNWNVAFTMVPLAVTSFGYQNLIPSLTTYLEGDVRRLKRVFVWGSFIPLACYLLWNVIILGIVPLSGFLKALDAGELATRALLDASESPSVILFAELFGFFALTSSCLAVALSFVDFLADGLHIAKRPVGRIELLILTFGPPLVCAYTIPDLFTSALSYAGAFGATVLYGVLPVLMVWVGRYVRGEKGPHILLGGKPLLILMFFYSLLIIGYKCL